MVKRKPCPPLREDQRYALATIHPCPSCDTLICAPGYMRRPHQCRRRKEEEDHADPLDQTRVLEEQGHRLA